MQNIIFNTIFIIHYYFMKSRLKTLLLKINSSFLTTKNKAYH